LALVKNYTHEWNTFISWFIDWKVLFLYFVIIYIYSEIEFIKRLDDVKIQRKTITFTKDGYSCTIFINKIITQGLWGCLSFFIILIFIYSILLAKCYAFA
jgi:hypothetical protein